MLVNGFQHAFGEVALAPQLFDRCMQQETPDDGPGIDRQSADHELIEPTALAARERRTGDHWAP